MTAETVHPLRLAVGSHSAGSGKGCAMNVISWENGDSTITDLPGCADPFLAKVVQNVNDRYCTHGSNDLLCPPCSLEVLALAHRTVGTRVEPAPRTVWVRIAAEEAMSVLPLFESKYPEDDRTWRAIEAALAWADEPSEARQAAAAAAAADAYAAAYATATARAAAAGATADAAASAAAGAATYAATATATAAYATAAARAAAGAAPGAAAMRLARAHHIIDRYLQLTGLTEHTIDEDSIARPAGPVVDPPVR